MLSFYASRLPAVEINNTFYRMPRASVLESWAEQVPADFRFAIKASRRITHIKRLKETADDTTYLLDAVQTLGERLGVLLFQLPPNLKKDLARLESFLHLFEGDNRIVFEFRNETWDDKEIFDLLRQRRCAVCQSETDEQRDPEIVKTAPFGYLRLRRSEYSRDELERWAKRIEEQGWDDVFVFFKHEDEGTGPRLAAEFRELAGGVPPA
jgi:uncharacterized protein YecE (DUF72 family)